MPRPKLKSDAEVLDAATAVLRRCGPLDFTLSEVANEVGLARATLIQRFTNRETLLVRMMERSLAQTRAYLDAMPGAGGPEELWGFLQALVRSMNTKYDFSVNFLISWYELQVPELRTLAIMRNRSVLDAIRRRLPPGSPDGVERLLHSIIAGASILWTVEPHDSLADYVLVQMAAVLRNLFPAHQGFHLATTANADRRPPFSR